MTLLPTGPYETTAAIAGGLALFLLAMRMMTNGLKLSAGHALRRLLGEWTSTPLRGVATGALITGMVQSSSAVTVATIGFVNAGLLSLGQAVGIVYGAAIGTTATSWLVSLVGLDFKIQAFALPLVALGVALLIAAPREALRGIGEALAGFGLFFLGLTILKEGMAGLTAALDIAALPASGLFGIALFVVLGFAMTLLMQSSSAAIALVLTSSGSGIIELTAAAAAIIGANLGTASTGILASIGATPNARRAALAHILFNSTASAIALAAFLPILWLARDLGAAAPTLTLALFHSAMCLAGLAVMLPLSGRTTAWLAGRFRTAQEDTSQPRHLDATVLDTPALAVSALAFELRETEQRALQLARAALSEQDERDPQLAKDSASLNALGRHVAEFIVKLDMRHLTHEIADMLPKMLRASRYFAETARLSPIAATLAGHSRRLDDAASRDAVAEMLEAANATLQPWPEAESPEETERRVAAQSGEFERAYQHAKMALLRAGAARSLDIETTSAVLTALSDTRRLVEQMAKGRRLLALEIAEIALPGLPHGAPQA
ncbi:MAG: Na/Pi cotransporter family protein [Alphaproteobacteria bacterium]